MLEITILSIIALAAVYWTALWLLGRHEDVLYGSFVTPPQGAVSDAPRRMMMPSPRADTRATPSAATTATRPLMMPPPKPLSRPPSGQPPVIGHTAAQRSDRTAAVSVKNPAPADALASLLETIKRDLNEAAGK
jgi:hypothetical protein